MVNVRPAARSASSFMMRREGAANAPRISEAAVAAIGAAPADAPKTEDRNETELGWRLRHLKRGVLRNETTLAGIPEDNDWFITDSFEFLGRAMGSSAKAATALFSDLSLGGQVNLLTTGAFDNPLQLLQLDRTSSVAFFSVGAPVGTHGDWTVRAAMNQSDLSSWMLAGSYVVKAQVPHRYQFGMSYSLQRYEGGNTAALMAVSDTARNVGSVFAYDEWQISRYISIGYGANYAHYDYLRGPELFSPRFSATFSPSKAWRVRAAAAREVSAPGAEEFIPPTSAEYLPPQRTFSAISNAGIRTQALQNYEFGIERVMNGAALGVRVFDQRINDQTVTVFGLRRETASSLGHYYVGAAGNAAVRGVGVTFTHALATNVRGSVDYSFASADWTAVSAPGEYAVLSRWVPSAVRSNETNSRRDDVARDRDSVLGDPRGGALQVERRVCRGRERRPAGVRRPVRHQGHAGAAVHELPHLAVGDAGRRPQPVPRVARQRLGLRRTPRRPSAQAPRGRPHRQVLNSPPSHYTCHTRNWIGRPGLWIQGSRRQS